MTSIAHPDDDKTPYLQKYDDIVQTFLTRDNGRWRSKMWRELGEYQAHVLEYAIRREKSLTGSDIDNASHANVFAIGLSATINHVAGVVFARERRERKHDWYWSPVMLRNALSSPRDSQARHVRSDIRRAIGLDPDNDPVEAALLYQAQQNDRAKTVSYDGSYTAHDAKKDKKRRQDARNYAMTQALSKSATVEIRLTPFAMTFTLPGEFHGCSHLKDAEDEINRRFNNIKQTCVRRGIPLLGTYALEQHMDETPHLHLVLYTFPGQAQTLNAIIRRQFPDNPLAEMEPVESLDGWLDYILKTVDEPFRKRVGFIGMAKGIKGRWDKCYAGEIVPGIDPRKLTLLHRLMQSKQRLEDWLFLMRGFRDEEYNASLDQRINKELGIQDGIVVEDVNVDADDDDDMLQQVDEALSSIKPEPVPEQDDEDDKDDDSKHDDSEQVITVIPGVGNLTVRHDESQVIANLGVDKGTWTVPGAVSVEHRYIDNMVIIKNEKGQDIFYTTAYGRISVNLDVSFNTVHLRAFRDKELASLTVWNIRTKNSKLTENEERNENERKRVNILDKKERAREQVPEQVDDPIIIPETPSQDTPTEVIQEPIQTQSPPQEKKPRFRRPNRRKVIIRSESEMQIILNKSKSEPEVAVMDSIALENDAIIKMGKIIYGGLNGRISHGQRATLKAMVNDLTEYLGHDCKNMTLVEMAQALNRVKNDPDIHWLL
ncbi:hypothetical protein [Gluconacetobacter tumulicola]|uniref:Replication protein n=1 Tax=Gluconacetobacter tumulicola TaxID=1017177 RepID=A0A7W4JEW3_9PROT|nr:hypothetical protein [Gluconacetobacter tumulicola]MBB2179913.1 hypothetical protein [Gluconacetobacter tumulicola]